MAKRETTEFYQKGFKARQRIRGAPSTKGGVPKAVMAREAQLLRDQGYTIARIAKALHRSDRYIRTCLAYARDQDSMIVIPDPRDVDKLAQEFRSMVAPISTEGFIRFFETFSGREFPEHAREWIQECIASRRLLLNVPPRHAKSTILTVWFVLYLVCGNRNIQILVVSHTATLAEKFAREIASHLEFDAQLIKAFGRFKPELSSWPWRPGSGELMVDGRTREIKSGDMTIQVRGAMQQVMGMEADWIFVDDPDDPKIAASEAERDKLAEWFFMEVTTRLEPHGHITVVGQRVHRLDLYGRLENQRRTRVDNHKVWKTIKYPAVLEWPSEGRPPKVLWPERWPFEELMEEYETLGAARFETLYQQNPLPDSERLVRQVWIEGDATHVGCLDRERTWGQPVKVSAENPYMPMSRVLSIDPSPTRQAGLVVADVLYTRDQFACYVLEMQSQKWSLRDTIAQIERCLVQYAPVDYFVFEQNAFARWLLEDPFFQQIKNRVRVIGHNTGSKQKGDPELGFSGMAVDFEFGRIRLPYEDAESRSQTDKFLVEAYSWPQHEYDDQLMALWFIKYNYKNLIPIRSLGTRRKGFNMPGGGGWARFRRDVVNG